MGIAPSLTAPNALNCLNAELTCHLAQRLTDMPDVLTDFIKLISAGGNLLSPVINAVDVFRYMRERKSLFIRCSCNTLINFADGFYIIQN